MKKTVLAIAIALACTGTWAKASDQGCESSGNTAAGCGDNISVNPNVTSTVNTNATGIGVGIGGRGGNQTQTATGGAGGSSSSSAQVGNTESSSASTSTSNASNSGNNQAITFSSPAAPEKVTVKTTGEAPAVLTNTTANCRVAIGASAGWLGGAFGFGTSVIDENCEIITLSIHMHNIGLKEQAVQMMCQSERAAKAMGPLCIKE